MMKAKINRKFTQSKIIMIAAIVCSILYIVIPTVGSVLEAPVDKFIGFMFLFVLAAIVLWVLYFAVYYPFLKNKKMLEKTGITYDYSLLGIEKAEKMPKSKIICADNSLIFEKQKWVIPYNSILWIYKQVVKGAYGLVTVEVNMIIVTTTGEKFKVTVDDNEAQWMLHNYGHRFSKDLILGYGPQQSKRYKAYKKQNKAR